MLPPEVGYEVRVNSEGLVEKVRGRNFVDVPMMPPNLKNDLEVNVKTEPKAETESDTSEEQGSSAHRKAGTEIRGSLHKVLSKMSPNLRARARPLLIRVLSTCPDLDFTQNGQLVYKNQTIQNSNLTNLLIHVLNRNNDFSVPGLKILLNSLRRSTSADKVTPLRKATKAELRKIL